jgi:polyisoprenoid-binding protein YceI
MRRIGSAGHFVAARLPAVLVAAILLPAPAQAGEAARWSADASGSRVGFVLHTFWHDVEGTTSTLTADLSSASGDPLEDGAVTISVEAATLVTGIGRRDRKMREAHLEVDKYPLLTFHSTSPPRREASPAPPGDNGAGVVVEGDLTIHGVTRKISVPISARADGEGWSMKGSLVVRLSDYGVPDPSIAINKVKDGVDLSFEIRFVRRRG